VPGMASSPPPLFERRRQPAAVVVDSRNVRGQVADLYGYPRHVDVPGVITMLAAYGFDVTDVWVGVGTQGRSGGSSYYQDSLRRNQDYADRILQDPRGHVLEGRLVERSTKGGSAMEEKLVDVLCALRIARLARDIEAGDREGGIVVLSEDMDLIPAYEFAAELGVPVYAAANDRVHTRHVHSKWLLLTEAALADAAGRVPGRSQGTGVRGAIANLLTVPEPRPLRFEAATHVAQQGIVLLNHNSGARAVWRDLPRGFRFSRNARHELYVVGVDWADAPFPRLVVSESMDGALRGSLIRGRVAGWKGPNRVQVHLAGGLTQTLDAASPGTLLPGMTVLVHHDTSEQEAFRLVGPLDLRAESPEWPNPTRPQIVRAVSTAATAGARVRARLPTGVEVTLQPPAEERAQAGAEYAAVPIEHVVTPSGVHVITVAVSSRLR
jgi:hypothetical protein